MPSYAMCRALSTTRRASGDGDLGSQVTATSQVTSNGVRYRRVGKRAKTIHGLFGWVTYGKRVITHGYQTNIEIAANLHFLANHRDAEVLEYSTSSSPLRWRTTRERIPIDADGMVAVPTRPGLGVTLDWEFVAAHRYD